MESQRELKEGEVRKSERVGERRFAQGDIIVVMDNMNASGLVGRLKHW